MAKRLRVTLEIGPKGKRFVAVAPDWPGLERGARTEEAALESLRAYVTRYLPIAKLAGMKAEYDDIAGHRVVERYPGSGSTDFWGISFAYSTIDQRPLSDNDLERELALMKACWKFFDNVRSRVSAEMALGPRGGGRDRDRIVRHTLAAELDWARKVGVNSSWEAVQTDKGLAAHRKAYCDGIRLCHAEGRLARKWPLRYLVRHTAFHTLDHAWEMEDKDLTGKPVA